MKKITATAALSAAIAVAGVTPAMAATPTPLKPLPCSSKTADRLLYNGGDTVYVPMVDLVFWGQYWKTDKAKPQISELQNLFKGLGSSHYAETITQYCDWAQGPNQQPDINGWLWDSGNSHIDATTPPAEPTDKQITDEVFKVVPLDDEGWIVPIVITPPGVEPAWDVNNHACGHHGTGTEWTDHHMVLEDFAWADVPYGLIQANPTGKCQPLGRADYGLSVVATHEWAETATDPWDGASNPYFHPGWGTPGKDQGEVGDMCSGQNPKLVTLTSGTGTFMLPALWSNEKGAGKGECTWSS